MMMDRFCTDVDVLAVAVARPSKASVSLQDNTNLFLELLLLLSIEHRAVTLLVVLQSNSTVRSGSSVAVESASWTNCGPPNTTYSVPTNSDQIFHLSLSSKYFTPAG